MDTCKIPKQSISISNKTIDNIPGDKSISHRAVIISSLAKNNSTFHNFLPSEDCLNTIKALSLLGVDIKLKGSELIVKGAGLHGLKKPNKQINIGNSGTSIRLLAGLLSAQPFDSKISGDKSIISRPMIRIIDPLSQMGAKIKGTKLKGKKDRYPPLTITGNPKLQGIRYALPVPSAQVKSAILFAGLFCEGPTIIYDPLFSRDHTEKMLAYFGAKVSLDIIGSHRIILKGKELLYNPNPEKPYLIPSDISSAMFFVVLSLLRAKSQLCLTKIGQNPTRTGIINILLEMGAVISKDFPTRKDFSMLEPYADLNIMSSSLKNIKVNDPKLIPNIIDEIPILAVASLFSEGDFVLHGAKELRVKESDRIQKIHEMIKSFGGEIIEKEDGFIIPGKQEIKPFSFSSGNDHRMAMSAIIAALAAGVEAKVSGCRCIATSFPNFFAILKDLGFKFKLID